MEQGTGSSDRIDFSVGDEMKLNDILGGPDVVPLLRAVLRAGAGFAAITDEKGTPLWMEGSLSGELQAGLKSAMLNRNPGEAGTLKKGDTRCRLSPLYHEGEPVGFLCICHSAATEGEFISSLAEIASASLNTMIRNNVKRLLTTEMHTKVVNQSYEELLEINKQLSASEKKYRELAGTLEKKVEERTAELKLALARLLQQEKMASIGHLAAGIAHEINNPVGFINSNLNTLGKYVRSVTEMIEFYKKAVRESAPGSTLPKQAEELSRKLKIDFILDDINELTLQSLEGSARIKKIVADLKGFSHIDESGTGELDINAELDKTISVLSHEIAARGATITRNYGRVPGLFCNPGLVCQAFLNILLNALQSKDREPAITVKTAHEGDNIVISITDNGRGIPHEIQGRIFDPFFTTKDVGKGMGMGLTVAYDIITAHGGGIEVRSEPGQGSAFSVTLPLDRSAGNRTIDGERPGDRFIA